MPGELVAEIQPRFSPSQNGEKVKLHLGCGTKVVDGWINIDGSWNARLARLPLIRFALAGVGLIPRRQQAVGWSRSVRFHNLTRPLPWADGSACSIYCCHVLEHLYYEEAKRLLSECFRVLARGGVLRVVVPDLHRLIQSYLADKERGLVEEHEVAPADRLNESLMFHSPARVQGSVAYKIYMAFTDFHSHKWMYDAESLGRLFRHAGLHTYAMRGLFESAMEDIRCIEEPVRMRAEQSICIEAIRP